MEPLARPGGFVGPHCPPHERAAVATCVRCGAFLCGECTELLGEEAYCGACATLVRTRGGPSKGLKRVFALQLAALLAVLVATLLGVAVATVGGQSVLGTLNLVLGGVLVLVLGPLNLVAAGVGVRAVLRERRGAHSPASRRWVGASAILAVLNLGYMGWVLWLFTRRPF